MSESRYKFSVWSSTEFLESDYDFLSKKKTKNKNKEQQKKKTGGVGGLTSGRGLESGVFLCSRWVYNWGSLEAAVYGLE